MTGNVEDHVLAMSLMGVRFTKIHIAMTSCGSACISGLCLVGLEEIWMRIRNLIVKAIPSSA